MSYMSEKKAFKIFDECLDDLYLASVPSISWAEIQEKYVGDDSSDFYLKHYISQERYDEIVNGYRRMLDKRFRAKFSCVLLDFAPTCVDEGDKVD